MKQTVASSPAGDGTAGATDEACKTSGEDPSAEIPMSMDRRLRALERDWRCNPSEELLDRILLEHRRTGSDVPLDLLRASPRWRRLTGFVGKWYSSPLEDEDGNSTEEIDETERRLGLRLPDAVREWFQLVGWRLQAGRTRSCTSTALRARGLQDLRAEPFPHSLRSFMALFDDGEHASWGISTADLEPADPPGEVLLLDQAHRSRSGQEHEKLSELLLKLVVRETLMRAGCGEDHGCLGPLGEQVMGGFGECHAAGASLEAYALLPLPTLSWPPTQDRLLGDRDTLIEVGEFHVVAAARSAEAWAKCWDLLQKIGWNAA